MPKIAILGLFLLINSSKQPIEGLFDTNQGVPLNVPNRPLEWDSQYLRSMEACLVVKIELNVQNCLKLSFLQQIAVICTN